MVRVGILSTQDHCLEVIIKKVMVNHCVTFEIEYLGYR